MIFLHIFAGIFVFVDSIHFSAKRTKWERGIRKSYSAEQSDNCAVYCGFLLHQNLNGLQSGYSNDDADKKGSKQIFQTILRVRATILEYKSNTFLIQIY